MRLLVLAKCQLRRLLYKHTAFGYAAMFTVRGPLLSRSAVAGKPVIGRVSCGFPSRALEYAKPPLSLDELVWLREPSIWLVRADGNSLRGLGIYDKNVLVVDRGLELLDEDVVIVTIGADFVAKQFIERGQEKPEF